MPHHASSESENNKKKTLTTQTNLKLLTKIARLICMRNIHEKKWKGKSKKSINTLEAHHLVTYPMNLH